VGFDLHQGRESPLFAVQQFLRGRGDYHVDAVGGRYVSDGVWNEITAMYRERRFLRLRAKAARQLSGERARARREHRWRVKAGADRVFLELSRYSWRSACARELSAMISVELENLDCLLAYAFDAERLAGQRRRAEFERQRHVAKAAQALLGADFRVKRGPTRNDRIRALAEDIWCTQYPGVPSAVRWRTHAAAWGRCMATARSRVPRGPAPTPKPRPSAARLTIVAVGDAAFSPTSRGHPPSSHDKYIKALLALNRPGTVVCLVDEHRTSLKCPLCSSDCTAEGRMITCPRCPALPGSGARGSTRTWLRDFQGAVNIALLASKALAHGSLATRGPWARERRRDGTEEAGRRRAAGGDRRGPVASDTPPQTERHRIRAPSRAGPAAPRGGQRTRTRGGRSPPPAASTDGVDGDAPRRGGRRAGRTAARRRAHPPSARGVQDGARRSRARALAELSVQGRKRARPSAQLAIGAAGAVCGDAAAGPSPCGARARRRRLAHPSEPRRGRKRPRASVHQGS